MNEGAVSQCVCPAPYHARCPDKILPWCCGCFVTPQIKTDETLWMRLLTVAVVVQGTERQGRVTPPVRILMLLEKCGEWHENCTLYCTFMDTSLLPHLMVFTAPLTVFIYVIYPTNNIFNTGWRGLQCKYCMNTVKLSMYSVSIPLYLDISHRYNLSIRQLYFLFYFCLVCLCRNISTVFFKLWINCQGVINYIYAVLSLYTEISVCLFFM